MTASRTAMRPTSASDPTRWNRRTAGWTIPEITILVIFGCFVLAFIARTAFRYHGVRTYSLFDDSMISMRYARNLAQGHGLRWNTTGKPVEGYTDLLWTLWMAALHLLPIPERFISAVVALSGGALLLANLVFVRSMTRRLVPGPHYLTAVSMALVALYYPLSYWTLRGMEVGLIATLSSGAVVLGARWLERSHSRDLILLCVVLAANVLTRSDSLLPAALIATWLVLVTVPTRRRVLAGFLATAILGSFAAQTILRVTYYGSALPNTYYLKLAHIPLQTRLSRGFGGLVTMGSLEFYGVAIVAVSYLLWCHRSVDRMAWLLGSLFAAQSAYSVYVGGDAWESDLMANRYLASEATALLILGVVSVHAMLRAEGRLRARMAITAAVLGAGVLTIRSADWRPASSMQLGRLPTEWWVTRVGFPATFVVTMIAVAVLGARAKQPHDDRDASAPRITLVIGLALVLAVGMSARELAFWSRHNAFLREDTRSAMLGLALRNATTPQTTIAFAAAGASAYFSHRQAIDLGGKSDTVIAREAPRVTTFIPGHDKYDYAYSAGVLKPDIVVLVGATTATDIRLLTSLGYQAFTPRLYVRVGTHIADRSALLEAGSDI